ncbi:hypothetical protein WSS_A00170 [Rhodococcus opacus M213]|uniref:DUF202 domain-containing protein n=2 Tax=Rhodococcus opacus TaxID=37919 RepID=K8Y4T4_RHOOP|nr:DUF202 domain-containing protein [Rhodococcus opacus]ANS31153.1 Conserved putative membrane protein [Rhodococcus opacus]EKT84800.1 hypothetical protein WSS_A00170 [Rhodococcus opacus M213]
MNRTVIAAPGAHVDEGLQPERTTLAWVRTSAVAALVTLLFLRSTPADPPTVATVGTVCLGGPMFLLAATRRSHAERVRQFTQETATVPFLHITFLAATVLVLATAAALCTVL